MAKRQVTKSLWIVSVLTGPKSDELTIRTGAGETIRLRAVGRTRLDRWELRNSAFDAIADTIGWLRSQK